MDIRNFFGGGGKPKDLTIVASAAAKPEEGVAKKKEESLPKDKTPQKKNAPTPSKAAAKAPTPAKAAAPTPAAKEKTPKKRSKYFGGDGGDDNDEDDDFVTEEDEESPAKKKKGSASKPKRKAAVVVSSDDEEEEEWKPNTEEEEAAEWKPSPKKPKPSPPPKEKKPSPKKEAGGKKTPKKEKKEPEGPPPQVADLVKAARAALPPPKYSIMEAPMGGGWGAGAGGGQEEPPNYGKKQVPRGAELCLAGMTFVITGTLDSLMRDEAEHLIKRYGGRVTSAVSGKTTFLLVGEQCGNSKIGKAQGVKCDLIDEDGLFSLISATASLAEDLKPVIASPPRPSALSSLVKQEVKQEGGNGPAPAAPAPRGPAACPSGGSGETELWTTKHKPSRSSDLVGNNTLVTEIRTWLTNWHDVHIKKVPQPKPKGGGGYGKQRDMTKKALLLSGGPGIGKTSAATILCRELGFRVMEVNASDSRGKATAKVRDGMGGKGANVHKEMVTNTAIGGHKQVLIMDEVDGLAGNQDRGGVADLIATIAASKIPIICICNDKYNQKLKSLKNHCSELEFRKPTKQQVAGRMLRIARSEGLEMDQNTMEQLIEGVNADIRLVLNQLQMIRLRTTRLTYDDLQRRLKSSSKDVDMSPFNAAQKLLDAQSAARLTMSDKIDLVFQDMDLVPLLVQENYLNHRPGHRPGRTPGGDERLEAIAEAAECISIGDTVNTNIRMKQNWGLMPFAASMGSVAPSAIMRGMREVFGMYPGEANFARFTAWLGNNSSSGKQKRLLGEVHSHVLVSQNSSCDRKSLRLHLVPLLRSFLTRPLAEREKEGVDQVIELMEEYCLTRDDVDAIMDLTKWKSSKAWAEDPFKKVNSQVKSTFTREYNKKDKDGSRKVHSGIMLPEAKKSRGKGKAVGDTGLGGLAEEGEDDPAADAEAVEDEGEEGEGGEQKPKLSKGINFTAKEVEAPKGKGKGKAAAGGKGKAAGGAKGKGKAKK